MPLFEFECSNCFQRMEKLLPYADNYSDPQFCPTCGDQMKQVPSAPAWFPSGKYGKGGVNCS
jgi:putative FmdB family regulatory protein